MKDKKENPQDKERSNAGRKQIFKNGEKAIPYWTSFPESKFDEFSEKVEEMRKPFLRETMHNVFKNVKDLNDEQLQELSDKINEIKKTKK